VINVKKSFLIPEVLQSLETAPKPDKTGSSFPESSSSQDRVGENGRSEAEPPPVGGDRIAPQVEVRLA
jgi:hypothetical protein